MTPGGGASFWCIVFHYWCSLISIWGCLIEGLATCCEGPSRSSAVPLQWLHLTWCMHFMWVFIAMVMEGWTQTSPVVLHRPQMQKVCLESVKALMTSAAADGQLLQQCCHLVNALHQFSISSNCVGGLNILSYPK